MYQQVEGHVDVFRRIYTDFYYDNYRVVIRVQDKPFLLSNFLKFHVQIDRWSKFTSRHLFNEFGSNRGPRDRQRRRRVGKLRNGEGTEIVPRFSASFAVCRRES